MISPTPRAVIVMMLGVPVMLLIAVFAPELWTLAGGWIAVVGGLMLLDAAIGARLSGLEIAVEAPSLLYIGGEDPATVTIAFPRGPAPPHADVRLETDERIVQPETVRLKGFPEGRRARDFQLRPVRRGMADITRVWVRWPGPLGLVHKRRTRTLALALPVTPNLRWVKEEAVRLYARDAEFGIKAQLERGDGSEFDALREFAAGMDRRAIDWKHSARHRHLLAKEFRTERNHTIVFAFDTGRLMSEPLGGVPKLDRAINAALLLGYVSLRNGDRTALFGFDARPRLTATPLTGTRAFPKLQAQAASLDYSPEDANYTLALSDLAGRLDRRSLIILFTDFVDTISAELMLENVRRLSDRHLIVFATFEDELLGRFVDAEPDTAEDVARAVIADTLLQERELVFRKLARLGVQVIETRPERFGADLVSRYLDIKRRELL